MLRNVPGADGPVHKSSFLRLVMSGAWDANRKKATDRLRRVAGELKFKKEQPEAAAAAGEAFLEASVHPDDPVAALV
eukprot:3462844-Prymnesium_polylepis.2